MKYELANNYISVAKDGKASYGGDQRWFRGSMSVCGCGIIGAADTLWYLKCGGCGVLSFRLYERYIDTIRKYFLLIPRMGMPGFVMAAAMKLCLRRLGLPFKASWGAGELKLKAAVCRMLSDDIPVPFCVGPGICPDIRRMRENKGLKLYELKPDGSYSWVKSAKKHFMVITASDGEWARISSWGEEYYINLDEYADYIRHDCLGLFSNIVSLTRRT